MGVSLLPTCICTVRMFGNIRNDLTDIFCLVLYFDIQHEMYIHIVINNNSKLYFQNEFEVLRVYSISLLLLIIFVHSIHAEMGIQYVYGLHNIIVQQCTYVCVSVCCLYCIITPPCCVIICLGCAIL